MRRSFIIFYHVLFLFLAASASESQTAGDSAAQSVKKEKLSARIDRILNDPLLEPCIIGIKVVSLQNGKVIYEKNSRKLFHPASNMKLFTTAAAINLLSRDFKFTTALTADRKATGGVITGNLYAKGSGDPLLSADDLDSLAASIERRGVRSIKGDLVGDVTLFDSLIWGQGWLWDDEPRPEEAFITPLTVNGNAVKVLVRPGSLIGNPPQVELQPGTSYLEIVNMSATSAVLEPPISIRRPRGENKIIIEGNIGPGSHEQEFTISVWKPELYFLHLLKDKLESRGIHIAGKIRLDSAKGVLNLAEISHSIDSVLYRINKNSDNLAAENLLKTLAAQKVKVPGTAQDGIKLVKEYLTRENIDTTDMILADASGLSWYNSVSPTQITMLLGAVHSHRHAFRRLIEALPVAGVDGTLRHRMTGGRTLGNVKAKTGSLTGGSAISGYLTSADGKLLAFSILCNHFPHELSILRSFQDKILELLASSKIAVSGGQK